MRVIKVDELKKAVSGICRSAHYDFDVDLLSLLLVYRERENNEIASDILGIIIENIRLAKESSIPLCQDTGIGIFFVEKGEEVFIEGGSLKQTIIESMAQVYREESLRKSIVSDPLYERLNTGNNLPPVIHWEEVPGDRIKITFLPKGAGAENMSQLRMFNPLATREEIINFIVETVSLAGGNACPPLIIGVGIGGTFDYAPLLAKKALLKPLKALSESTDRSSVDNIERSSTKQSLRERTDKSGEQRNREFWLEMERATLARVNELGIGPLGLGGKTTALQVSIETYPCHIASLPVAVNLQCHSHRFQSIII
jgi:fumarate hydratase subunit alpha